MIPRRSSHPRALRLMAWASTIPLLVGLAGLAMTWGSEADRAKPAVAGEAPKGYVCEKAAGPIKVDGRLDEESWQFAPWTDAFVDIEGDAKPRPRFRTRAKMLWDDRYFYVAAELEEPHVWG